MVRTILSVLAGVFAAAIVVLVVEAIGHAVYPTPAIDMSDREAVRRMLALLPLGALVIVVVGWGLAALTGGAVARLVLRRSSAVPSLVTGFLFLLETVGNMLLIPHPIGVWIAGILMPLPLAFLGGRLASPEPRLVA